MIKRVAPDNGLCLETEQNNKGQIFLLVDLRDFFSDLGSGVRKKIYNKNF